MINHIVFLQVALQANTKQINAVLEELGNLRYTAIPQIKAFSYGENCSPEGLSQGYNYGFTMQFSSTEDRDYYLQHPEHIKWRKKL